jgi:hypothetical protein
MIEARQTVSTRLSLHEQQRSPCTSLREGRQHVQTNYYCILTARGSAAKSVGLLGCESNSLASSKGLACSTPTQPSVATMLPRIKFTGTLRLGSCLSSYEAKVQLVRGTCRMYCQSCCCACADLYICIAGNPEHAVPDKGTMVYQFHLPILKATRQQTYTHYQQQHFSYAINRSPVAHCVVAPAQWVQTSWHEGHAQHPEQQRQDCNASILLQLHSGQCPLTPNEAHSMNQ